MTGESPSLEAIRRNAELVVSVAAQQLGETIGFDEAGVRWLDGYIQTQHEQGDPGARAGLINTLGSYLGECIIHVFGGGWSQTGGAWCVCFDERNSVFPFAKVAKHLENGVEDSVLGLFTAIPLLFSEAVRSGQ
jgi:hypothetical protein